MELSPFNQTLWLPQLINKLSKTKLFNTVQFDFTVSVHEIKVLKYITFFVYIILNTVSSLKKMVSVWRFGHY